MNFLRRDTVCSMLRLSPQQGYRIIGTTEYGARISSSFVVEMLNRSRVGDIPAITGDSGADIPSDLMSQSEIASVDEIAKSDISCADILNWSNRKRNPLPHYRINRKMRLYRRDDVMRWLNARSPRKVSV